MMLGRCCICERTVKLVNLKGFDAADGSTLWEYGLASMYCLRYGANEFLAIKHDATITANKFGVWAQETVFLEIPPRIAGALPALYAETLTVVKIDATDGTEISSTALDDWYAETGESSSQSVRMMNARLSQGTIGEPFVAALSGGKMAFLGRIEPAVIWDDRTDNDATKSYRLLPHTQSEGKVYFLTKTNRQTITCDYNDTAAEIETAFEAVADVVSATATGGPWPLVAIDLTVTWSAATGDIQGIKRDSTVTLGTPPATSARPVASTAFTIDPATGLLVNTCGHRLGRGNSSAISDLMPSPLPGTNITLYPPRLGAERIIAADSNLVGLQSTQNETVECWDASPAGANGWTRSWALYRNTPVVGLSNMATLQCQNASFSLTVPRQSYDGTTYTGATIPTSAATPAHWDNDRVSTSTANTARLTGHVARDGNTAFRWCDARRRLSTGQIFYFAGIEHSDTTTDLALGVSQMFGVSSTRLFVISSGNDQTGGASPVAVRTTNVLTTGTLAGSLATFRKLVWYWPGTWYKPNTEFRFTFFPGGGASISTAWVAWPSSAAGIATALTNLFGENTEGVYSNVQVWPTGAPGGLDNTSYSELQQNIDILFAVRPANDNPFGHVPAQYINTSARIEVRYAQTMTQGDLTAFDAADGDIVWSRYFGYATNPTTSVDYPVRPLYAWYRGDYVWAAGGPINAE
jgi:hypothetical protein